MFILNLTYLIMVAEEDVLVVMTVGVRGDDDCGCRWDRGAIGGRYGHGDGDVGRVGGERGIGSGSRGSSMEGGKGGGGGSSGGGVRWHGDGSGNCGSG